MKNFKLFVIFAIGIISMPKIQTTSSPHQASQLSMMNYVSSYMWQQSESIPSAQNSTKKVIIFDLDGVLCTTNKLRAFQEIGMGTIAQFIIEHLTTPSSAALFKALNNAPAITSFDAYNEGIRMPQCMVDWQIGAQELRDIQDNMVQHILASNLTISEKNLYVQTILMMTTPSKFITTRQIIPDALQLARTLKKLGYKLYILSNWDPSSFPVFMAEFPELFTFEGKDLFDGIMTSGQQRMLKPNKDIYEACLTKFKIKRSQAIFIDDTIENVQAAQNLGIDAIQCCHKNIIDVKQQLIKIIKKS